MAKNTKQSKQKKSVLNKLGGLSKRSKFIVVVLIFAVLGGGYLTYKSFAATNNPSIISYAEDFKFSSSGCNSALVADPAKGNLTVMNLYCPPGYSWVITGKSPAAQGSFDPKGYYFACVMMKGVGGIELESKVNTSTFSRKKIRINDSQYKEYCGDAVKVNYGYPRLTTSQIQVRLDTESGSDRAGRNTGLFTIRSIYFKYASSNSVAQPSSK